MNLILILIFINLTTTNTQSCDRIHCRYTQNSANIRPAADNMNNFHFQQNHEIQQITKFSSPKSISGFCMTFLSSNGIESSDFAKMHDCNSIDLSGNGIDEVEIKFFVDLRRLESLNFDENRLRSLPEKVFDNLESLRKISMRSNFLESLDGDLFKFNFKLESVDFSDNKISRISPNIFNNLKSLKFASVRGNFCINSAFPVTTLEKLKTQISTMCSERNIIAFIVSLVKIKAQIRNVTSTQNNQTLSENQTIVTENISTTATTTKTTSTRLIVSNQTTPKIQEPPTDLDVLLISLFWLIVPIILILFAILAAIAFAIYNKYFKYSVEYSRRN